MSRLHHLRRRLRRHFATIFISFHFHFFTLAGFSITSQFSPLLHSQRISLPLRRRSCHYRLFTTPVSFCHYCLLPAGGQLTFYDTD